MARWIELEDKLEALQRWERRKRREVLLVEAFVYAALAALVMLLLRGWLPGFLTPLSLVLPFFALVAAVLLVWRRYRTPEFLGALHRLDRALRLDECALTASELLSRRADRPSERLVLEEAQAGLEGVSFRTLFARDFGWRAYAAPILAVLLLATPWFPAGAPHEVPAPAALAEEVKQLASETEKEARKKDLTESQRIARELAEVAEKKLRGESSEAQLGHALGAIIDSIEDVFQSLPAGEEVHWPGIGAQQLSDLRQRLEELQQPQSLSRPRGDGSGLLDQLGLGSMAKRPDDSQSMSEDEIRDFLEKLSQEARAEEERRLLSRTQEALSQLVPGNPRGPGTQQFASPGMPDRSQQPEREQGSPGSLPGDAQARSGVAEAYDPAFRAKVRSHLEGLLGEGPSRGFGFRGPGKAGTSTTPEQEVVVRYERQIEEQMSSEEIPADFKETIKKYFLSLGVTGATQ